MSLRVAKDGKADARNWKTGEVKERQEHRGQTPTGGSGEQRQERHQVVDRVFAADARVRAGTKGQEVLRVRHVFAALLRKALWIELARVRVAL